MPLLSYKSDQLARRCIRSDVEIEKKEKNREKIRKLPDVVAIGSPSVRAVPPDQNGSL